MTLSARHADQQQHREAAVNEVVGLRLSENAADALDEEEGTASRPGSGSGAHPRP